MSAFTLGFWNVTDTLSSYLRMPLAETTFLGVALDGHLLLETILVVVIVALMTQKSYKPDKKPLTEKEIEQLCEDWTPEPLHPPVSQEVLNYEPPILESAATPRTIVGGRSVINFGTMNFLGMIGNAKVKEACEATVKKYGVGSCGPRGFYGTIDVHLDLEERISKFMGVDDCILYSYGLATASSTIPAFCKKGDLIIADEGVGFAIQNGITLSRSSVKYFRHNDMGHLEQILQEISAEDRRVGKKVRNRRFIMVESIYQSSGKLLPLDKVVELKKKHLFRVLVDESLSFGVLGPSGRGICDHFNIPVSEVDIIVSAMGTTLASAGGFCCGDARMVDHQRLGGLGYCFSASLPPYLASAATAALDEIEGQKSLSKILQRNIKIFRRETEGIRGLELTSDPASPLLHFSLQKPSASKETDFRSLQSFVDEMLENSVLVTVSQRSPIDRCKLPIGVRVCISAGHTEKDLLTAAKCMKSVAENVF